MRLFEFAQEHSLTESDSPVAGAITRRIIMQRSDLLQKYGPQKVMAAIDDVADFVGDTEEIGSSDVSGWVKQVEQSLASMGGEGVAEGYDSIESDYEQWEGILEKDGYRDPDVTGADALKLVAGDYRGPQGYISTIRSILTYVKQNSQVLGKVVADRKTVKDCIMDIKNEYPQYYQAAQQQGVAEAGRYGSNNPDTMSPNNYDRYQQDQMDQSKRDFKRREHEHEWEQEKAYTKQLQAQDRGPWYIRIDGKIYRQGGQPKSFDWKKGANNYALAMVKNNPALQGKVMLSKSAEDK